jgi:hypothetical protein
MSSICKYALEPPDCAGAIWTVFLLHTGRSGRNPGTGVYISTTPDIQLGTIHAALIEYHYENE